MPSSKEEAAEVMSRITATFSDLSFMEFEDEPTEKNLIAAAVRVLDALVEALQKHGVVDRAEAILSEAIVVWNKEKNELLVTKASHVQIWTAKGYRPIALPVRRKG